MKNFIKILAVFAGAVAMLGSCSVYDELPPCEDPAVGVTRIRLYVESFLGNMEPLRARSFAETSERVFSDRIEKLDYYLYRDGVLVENGPVNDVSSCADPFLLFERRGLPYGRYKMVFTGNCAETVMRGSIHNPDELTILYQDGDGVADFFAGFYEFDVRDDGVHQYDAQLKRLHGVVRFTFNDVDPEIKAIEITMDGLTSTGCVMGTYSEDYTFVRRIPVNQPATMADELLPNEPTIVGLFPTMDGGNSSWSVKIYKDDGDVEYFSQTISNDVLVVRNDLVDLSASFAGGTVRFYIDMDLVWEGMLDGGGAIVD